MKIERGTLQQYEEELQPLFEEHWAEIGMAGLTGVDIPLGINKAHYRALEEAGMYLAIALKTDDGKLVGYLSIFIFSHPHHQSVNFACVDCFMISKSYRNMSGFSSIIKMFKMAEEILKADFNVKVFQFGFSANNPLASLTKRLGFVESDIVYVKQLECK